MSVQAVQAYFTPEEYLELERQSQFRHEYCRGLVYAMAGAKRSHIQITDNLHIMLAKYFDNAPCSVFASEMKVRIESADCYYYPDVLVSCNEQDINSDEDFLLYPKLIIEVLSKSTGKFDRTDKFLDYQQLTSLEEYVLVSQDAVQIECHRKQQSGEWISQCYGVGDVVELHSIGFTCPIEKIYHRVLGLIV